MDIELQQIVYALLLAALHLTLYAILANVEIGPDYTAGPRDRPPPEPMSATLARLGRAWENCNETLPWFAVAMFAAHLGGKVDASVIAAGWTYLAARVVYLPVYVFGIPYLRSAVWSVATGAILFIAIVSLL